VSAIRGVRLAFHLSKRDTVIRSYLSRRVFLASMITALISVACGSEPLPSAQRPLPNTLSDLVADPGRFDGARIQVSGWCRVEFEGNALYADKAAFERRVTDRAVWLNLGWPVTDRILALNGTHVVVEGLFDARRKGHEALFRGTVVEVSRIEQTPEAKEGADQRP
jgi:hypothetical protein